MNPRIMALSLDLGYYILLIYIGMYMLFDVWYQLMIKKETSYSYIWLIRERKTKTETLPCRDGVDRPSPKYVELIFSIIICGQSWIKVTCPCNFNLNCCELYHPVTLHRIVLKQQTAGLSRLLPIWTPQAGPGQIYR